MKAIGAPRFWPVEHECCLVEFEAPMPVPGPRDLLVQVEAAGINPVDAKVRRGLGDSLLASPRILGWDAAGVVVAVGAEVNGFQTGDRVYYAGDVTRPGSNALFQCVDERLTAHAPATLGLVEAAAWPLASLTAWELLHERMGVDVHGGDAGKWLLVINGAGGVGSVLIQLAKHAGLRVVATASRPETMDWCRAMGAEHVIDHHQPLGPQLAGLGLPAFPLIANLYLPDPYWTETAEWLAPFGTLGLIVEPAGPLPVGDPFKMKAARIVWEFMFARSKFQSADMARQGEILEEIACRIDAGQLKPVLTQTLSPFSVANLRQAHAAMEAGTAHGKWVVGVIGDQ
jgi:NADPH2:quinone reductase